MKRLYTTRRTPRSTAVRRLTYMLLLLGLGIFLLTGCASTLTVNEGDLNLVSLDQEWQIGERLEGKLDNKLDLVSDPALTEYVRSMGQRIVNQTPMADRPWEFYVVADDAVNAFNTPGGYVYVHTGLIAAADNAAQLAGAMAHEIAHGVARHGTERLTKAKGLNLVGAALLGEDPGGLERLAAQIAATGAMASFSRDDEREADRLGVHYMYEASYDPMGMAGMFRNLLQLRERQPNAVAQFFSTHPLTSERIEDVRRYARQLPDRSGLITHDDEFQAAQQRAEQY